MPILEVFFDYACPYCLKGHQYLEELLPQYPHIEVVWRPCEAHPRPDPYGPHSDLCIQGLFHAQQEGADVEEYHHRMYRAALEDRINIEDQDKVAGCVADLLNAADLRQALEGGAYETRLWEANRYAFGESGVWAVPAYRMDGRKLDAVENVGVTKAQLRAFLDQA